MVLFIRLVSTLVSAVRRFPSIALSWGHGKIAVWRCNVMIALGTSDRLVEGNAAMKGCEFGPR
jgi:hypothetical protein